VTFVADDSTTRRKVQEKSEPAALIEITAGGATEQVWLRRNDPAYGQTTIPMPGGIMALSCEHGRVPLGYALRLIDFKREVNPGSVGNAAFSSKVRVVDSRRSLDQERIISMNQPLTHGNFTFYQSSFDEAGHGRDISAFSVGYDPGRTLKYCGSLMICLGIAIMFFMRSYFFKSRRLAPIQAPHPVECAALADQRPEKGLRRAA
jgi:hypothetical protein